MNDVAPATFDEQDIQAWVAVAYKLRRCRHFILRVKSPGEARGFVAALSKDEWVSSVDDCHPKKADQPDASWQLNIAFTYAGLEALGLDEQLLRVFCDRAPAFAEGAYRRAAQRLADTGASAVQNWEDCFKPTFAHVLLSVHASDEHVMEAKAKELEALGSGLEGWESALDGSHLANGRNDSFDPAGARLVHFGFRDGVSSVSIKGLPAERDPKGDKVVAAGKFLLGEADDEGVNAWVLARYPVETRKFFRDGSFTILRMIEQDEAAFREFLAREMGRLGVDDRAYVKAKMLGRWDDGSVVSAQPTSPSISASPPADLDDFVFAADASGYGCPFGSHIRRMNPRDDPVVPSASRPLIRRGIPYGPPYEGVDPGASRGLLGLFFCASIEDQFEHLLSQWGDKNPMGTGIRGSAKDPLVGNHSEADAWFDIPMADGSSRRLTGFKPFVRTRGTLYAFVPTLSALKTIAGFEAKQRGARSAAANFANADVCPICAPNQPL